MVNRIKQSQSSTRKLARALQLRGLSQDVADELGVSRQFISQVIHGVRNNTRVADAIEREYRRRVRRLDRESAA